MLLIAVLTDLVGELGLVTIGTDHELGQRNGPSAHALTFSHL